MAGLELRVDRDVQWRFEKGQNAVLRVRLCLSSAPQPPLLSMERKALHLTHILSSGDLPPRPFPPSLLHLRISVPSLPFDWFPIPAAQLQSTCISQSLAQ